MTDRNGGPMNPLNGGTVFVWWLLTPIFFQTALKHALYLSLELS